MEAARTFESPATETRERLEAFVAGVTARLPHIRQRENALLYVRGLVEHGGRKSLQPTLGRLGESPARYESVQQFLADSPWQASQLVRACAEWVTPKINVTAWIVDDTGIKKDGDHSPGVKRQYSGTLGKIDNCQVCVSLHVAGTHGTLPIGWRLYLPEEWCSEPERRERAKVPSEVVFKTKPELAGALIEKAADWQITSAPVLADQAYGDDARFRTRLDGLQLEYLVSVSAQASVWPEKTSFAVPPRQRDSGRGPSVLRADRSPASVRALAANLPEQAWQVVAFRTTQTGEEVASRFAFVRVIAVAPTRGGQASPRAEWLIVEWPEGQDGPSDYWLSNLPADAAPERLARLARLRWTIELDYRQLKGELGLDHYEGRSYLGFHHHTALVTCAHAFLTLERLCPKALRPA